MLQFKKTKNSYDIQYMNEKELERLLVLEKKLFNLEKLTESETKEFEKLFGTRVKQLIKEHYRN